VAYLQGLRENAFSRADVADKPWHDTKAIAKKRLKNASADCKAAQSIQYHDY